MTQEEALTILQMGYNVFLTGEAGAGKTYILQKFISHLRSHKIKVAITASTGIAATHLGGLTIHSWSGIGVRSYVDEQDIDEILQKEKIYKRFRETSVLIIDEVSMLTKSQLEGLSKMAQIARESREPFGGMQIVLVGDFFQLPPVSKGVPSFAFESPVWSKLNLALCYLSSQHRQEGGELYEVLKALRSGDFEEYHYDLLMSRVGDHEADKNLTRLFTHNVNVDEYNEKELEKLPGAGRVFSMTETGNKTLVEMLKKGSLAKEEITLKKGAIVMFIKNNFEKGYVNGSIGKVIDISKEHPVIELVDGRKILGIPDDFVIEEDGKIKAKITQIPLRLAWAITIHKSQGMSLDAAYLDLRECFIPGQGYVALSRLRNLEGLFLKGFNKKSLEMDERVRVFDERAKRLSAEASRRLQALESDEIAIRTRNFIKRSGGLLKPLTEEEMEEGSGKVTTYEKTLTLLLEKKTVEEIADARGLGEATIFSHIEHLKLSVPDLDIEHLRGDDLPIQEIVDAFKEKETLSLSLIKDYFNDKYSFEELRLARLFLK